MKISAYIVMAAAIGLPAPQAALARDQNPAAKTTVSQPQKATSWKKGGKYKGSGKKIIDYRQQNLPAPATGYHWVKDGKTYLLIDSGKGTISSIKGNAR